MPKLNSVWGFKDDGKGVFYYIDDIVTDTPDWLDDIQQLDAIYHLNHSGNKLISPMIESLWEDYHSDTIPSGGKTFIATIIWKKFNKKWARLWDLYTAEYDPLENYALTEIEKPQITRTHKGATTHKVSDDYEYNETTTDETDITISGEVQRDVGTYGFQNSSPVPTGLDASQNTSRTTGDAEHNISSRTSTQTGSTIDDVDFTDKETGNRQLTRRGQIGVMTYKDMIANEVELWQWNFYDTVMADIDSLLTLAVYDYNKFERM